ncbi:MAG: hypothetical protein O3B95_12925 [Chloroflexi bacterium]|nr:hypothetical protein [Chloroflexota bacterium]
MTEALFADSTWIAGPLKIEDETPHFLMIRFYQYADPSGVWRPGMLSRQSVRYLMYGDHVIPYLDGSPQQSMQHSRNRTFPEKNLLLLGLASFGASVWMSFRSGTADKNYKQITPDISEIADQKARFLRQRERFELYSGVSMVVGFGLSLAGLQWESNWTLSDGTVILPVPGGRYQIRVQ